MTLLFGGVLPHRLLLRSPLYGLRKKVMDWHCLDLSASLQIPGVFYRLDCAVLAWVTVTIDISTIAPMTRARLSRCDISFLSESLGACESEIEANRPKAMRADELAVDAPSDIMALTSQKQCHRGVLREASSVGSSG